MLTLHNIKPFLYISIKVVRKRKPLKKFIIKNKIINIWKSIQKQMQYNDGVYKQ